MCCACVLQRPMHNSVQFPLSTFFHYFTHSALSFYFDSSACSASSCLPFVLLLVSQHKFIIIKRIISRMLSRAACAPRTDLENEQTRREENNKTTSAVKTFYFYCISFCLWPPHNAFQNICSQLTTITNRNLINHIASAAT